MSSDRDGFGGVFAFALDEWAISLEGGGEVIIRAHSVRRETGVLVFEIAIEGSPLSLVDVARLPESLVRDYWMTPGETGPESCPHLDRGMAVSTDNEPLRCCFCGGDPTTDEYVEMSLKTPADEGQQWLGAHRGCLQSRLAPDFRVEVGE